ncbi:metallophosphoesterase [Paracoccus sp. WLY502]|uniref:metallophosphoesterase n=1 Tax=Paracoccus yibinensis TaxID=3068891 RepID=UPI0027966D55|nr:metallophosphoesterase [Paracoccus sp. WLY502]MDQ1901463.1 metallophosphoesterase [Paracoccus sp. WLY502]
MRLYVIGDVHGHLDKLKAAHDRVFRDGGRDAVIAHVGDLIDRGPDSRGVVEYLMTGQAEGRPWTVTRGNHDRFLPQYVMQPDWVDPDLSSRLHWTLHSGLGAPETLRSYGVDPTLAPDRMLAEAKRAVPGVHAAYLASLPLYFLHPLALVVHAGIRPGVDLQDQTEEDLVWIRQDFLNSPVDHGPLVVHGHTAIQTATHYGNRLNVDGGAAYGRPLCAVVIERDGVHLLADDGRLPLEPENLPCD